MKPTPRTRYLALVATVLVALIASPVASKRIPTDRPPDQGGFTRSMGIPSLLRKQVGVEFHSYRTSGDAEIGGLVNVGLTRSIGHPVVGIAALGVEGYVGARAYEMDGGGRAYFLVPSLLIGAGVDYNIEAEEADFLLKLDIPTRRRGIVGGGSFLTLRWLPTRDQTFTVGLSIPVGDRNAGKTRPQSDYVKMDDRRPQRLEFERLVGIQASYNEALRVLRERALWVARLTQPFAEKGGADAVKAMAPVIARLRAHMDSTDTLFPGGHTLNEEIRVYHETLVRAFSIAESGRALGPGESTAQGRRIDVQARCYLLDNIIFPYNYLFGQLKKQDTLSGMTAQAQTNFARWLLSGEEIGDEAALRVFYVFQTLCDLMEANRAELRERWGDNRYVWLPLQYGLHPEEHDTQAELDGIIERATLEDFTRGNRLWYIMNEEFQFEMARSVRLAEDYHVLWIHDVAGMSHGNPDYVAYEQVRNYFMALIERVRAYDDTGKLPMYLIFLDQHYFETNKGRLWMRLLQAPLDHALHLDKEHVEMQAEIERLQAELRQAVDESLVLRLEKSQYGEKWLKNRIKVHVNITNPADFSFYSMKIVGKMPIPDNNMRDHRKIIFYDITEEDPYRGMAMFTGMGLGEHYVGATWEDRAIMLQGPGALATKDAARGLLEVQGFRDEEIPYPLRPLPKPASYQEKIDAEIAGLPPHVGDDGVIQLHNETGFTPKPLNVAKCVLYSLMPPGSLLKVPDSLWQSYVYASLMAGSALRGCRVLVIAPSLRAAPSSGAPQMERANGLMKRIVVFGNEMDDYMEAEGGLMRVGLYAPRQGVGDIAGRFRQAVDVTLKWADRVYHFDPNVEEAALGAQKILNEVGYKPVYITEKDSLESPKLHLKANFFASAAAWDKLMARPEWGPVTRHFIRYLARQQGAYGDGDENRDVRAIPEELARSVRQLVSDYYASLSPQERDEIVLYLTVGSANMDYRSQVMNAEVMTTLGGVKSLIGVMDFVLLTGLCEWPETPEEVDELLPPPGWVDSF